MSYTVYILYSPSIDRYYTGYTSSVLEERLRKHNSNHKGFTGKANDWIIIFSTNRESKSAALSLEKSIKQRGAKRYMNALSD